MGPARRYMVTPPSRGIREIGVSPMAIWLRRLLVLVAMAISVSAPPAGGSTPTTLTAQRSQTSISGHIADVSGIAVEGALIQLFPSADVRSDGQYFLETRAAGTPGQFALPGINIGPMSSRRRFAGLERPERVTTSDVNGNFEIPSVLPGYYLLTAQALSSDGTTLSAGARVLDFNARSLRPEETSWKLNNVEKSAAPTPLSSPTAIVYYMTDRNPNATSTQARPLYSNDFADGSQPRYGSCVVEEAGQLRTQCQELSARVAISRAVTDQRKAPHSQLIVFAHGFNVDFTEAIRVAGALATGTHRPVFVYDWASAKTLLYTPDEDRVRGALINDGRQFIEDLADAVGVRNLVLVGHSMGARAAFQFANTVTDKHVGHGDRLAGLIFFAGDEFETTVRGGLHNLDPSPDTVLNYTSNRDIALLLSLAFHFGNQRIGADVPRIVVVDGMQTVESSRAQTDWLGHGYFTDLGLLEDLNAALDGTPPAQRTKTLAPHAGQNYFDFLSRLAK